MADDNALRCAIVPFRSFHLPSQALLIEVKAIDIQPVTPGAVMPVPYNKILKYLPSFFAMLQKQIRITSGAESFEELWIESSCNERVEGSSSSYCDEAKLFARWVVGTHHQPLDDDHRGFVGERAVRDLVEPLTVRTSR